MLAVVFVFLVVRVLPMIVFGAVAVLIAHHRIRTAIHRCRAPAMAPHPSRPALPRPDVVWARARSRFAALRGEYAAYECDPMNVLRLPALADVSVPSTARFVEAFAEAQALDSDILPPPAHVTAFVAAVERAGRAWQAARDAAERIRLSGLSPAERSTVERVIKLLTTAHDSDSDAERLTAYSRARAELHKLDRAGVLHLPHPAQSVLDNASRGQLPA
ncbi:MAG: hypothetical protein ACRDRH_15720 [Pseudonocardia sp.]